MVMKLHPPSNHRLPRHTLSSCLTIYRTWISNSLLSTWQTGMSSADDPQCTGGHRREASGEWYRQATQMTFLERGGGGWRHVQMTGLQLLDWIGRVGAREGSKLCCQIQDVFPPQLMAVFSAKLHVTKFWKVECVYSINILWMHQPRWCHWHEMTGS